MSLNAVENMSIYPIEFGVKYLILHEYVGSMLSIKGMNNHSNLIIDFYIKLLLNQRKHAKIIQHQYF